MANRKQRRAEARSKESETEAVTPDEVLSPGDAPAMPFPDHEEDALFKMQMRVQNLLLGHWKKGVAVVGTFLLGVLAVGEYGSWVSSQQQTAQAEIADIDRKMPQESPLVQFGLQAAETDADTLAQIAEGARRYEAVAQTAKGAGAAIAWARAGDAWQRVDDSEKAQAAYGSAHALSVGGLVGWSVGSAYANLQADAGDIDGAVATLKGISTQVAGLPAEQALFTAGLILEDADRHAESLAIFQSFTQTYPNSTLAVEVARAQRRVGGDG